MIQQIDSRFKDSKFNLIQSKTNMIMTYLLSQNMFMAGPGQARNGCRGLDNTPSASLFIFCKTQMCRSVECAICNATGLPFMVFYFSCSNLSAFVTLRMLYGTSLSSLWEIHPDFI